MFTEKRRQAILKIMFRKLKSAAAVVLTALTLLVAFGGCTDGSDKETPTEKTFGTGLPETGDGGGDTMTQKPAQTGFSAYVQKSRASDYVYMWWPNGWQAQTTKKGDLYFRSGTYAMSWDVANGSINRLGITRDGKTQAQAALEENGVVESMPESSGFISLSVENKEYSPSAFGSIKTDLSKSPSMSYVMGPDTKNPSRIEDSGMYMQRSDIPYIVFGDGYVGKLKIAAAPRHITLEYSMRNIETAFDNATLTYTIKLNAKFNKAEWSEDKNALTLTDSGGNGFTFVSPDEAGRPSITLSKTSVTFTKTGVSGDPDTDGSMGFTIIPSKNASVADGLDFLSVQNDVSVEYARLSPGGAPGSYAPSTYDPLRGMHVIQLEALTADRNAGEHNVYNRVHFILKNPTDRDLYVPLVFDDNTGNAGLYIVGGAPMLRDAETGEPVGIPVQLSKNWHDTLLGYSWYHLYTGVTVPADGSVKLEFCMANSKWGQAYAASHSQLCLIGYGNSQLWCESALGCNGESVTYDADKNLNRSNIDDVRPFLVLTGTEAKWNWTGNVGGGDFLRYFDASGKEQKLVRMKTDYRQQAPSLTDVAYNGITEDGHIQMTARARLASTDDVIRVYYQFEYEFLKDTSYKRLALFQMQADGYNIPSFERYAIGNSDGILEDFYMPEMRPASFKYVNPEDQGIEASGADPWFYIYSNRGAQQYGSDEAGVMFTVRKYNAVINNQTYTQPYYSKIGMAKGNVAMGFEVAIPNTETVKAGSTVTLTVEYAILGNNKDMYYGECPYLLDLPAETWKSAEMALFFAKGNNLTAEAAAGELICTYPVEIKCVDGNIAAQFKLTGGLGYTPLVFTHLNRYDGWRLESSPDGSAWTKVDLSVKGNDYWQCYYDAAADAYQLIYCVPNGKETHYRLTKE